jgi:hypothetical protein
VDLSKRFDFLLKQADIFAHFMSGGPRKDSDTKGNQASTSAGVRHAKMRRADKAEKAKLVAAGAGEYVFD